MGKNQSASGLTNIVQYDNNGNITFVSGSTTLMQISSSGQITTTGVISGSNALSSSYALNSGLLNETGSVGFATTGSLLIISSSQQQISASQQQISSSLLALTASYNALSSSYTALSASYNTASSSFSTRITSDSSSLSSRTTQIENVYATTGSNTFTGTQNFSNTCTPNSFTGGASIYTAGGLRVTQDAYFSSSVYIKGNVTVFGTQSVSYISSSQLDIGTNIITVNTATPSVRYGGLSVFDSGSTGLTGSIFWDSELNRWIYVNASGSGGGATYGGGMFISGPRNSVGLGCEQGTTACMLLAGQGGDHLTSSMIYHSSTVTCIPNTLIGSTICTTMANASCIGIGTTTPTHPLEIYAATGNQLKISTNDATSANNSGIFFYNEASATSSTRRSYILLDPNGANGSGGDYSYFDMYGSGTTRLMNQLASGLLALGVGGTNIINITGSSVGIGTSSPTSNYGFERNLTISSTNNAELQLVQTGNSNYLSIGITNGTNYFQSTNAYDFQIGGGSKMRITSGGNVGIGTITPYQKLVNTGHIALTTACAGTDATADVQRAAIGWQATASDTVLGSFITAANQGNWGSDMQFYTRPSTGGNAVLRLTIANSGAATFCSSVTATSESFITGGDGAGKMLKFTGGTTKYNFMIAVQQNVSNALEITPSTAAGGSTFSTPALTIASTGNVGIGTDTPTDGKFVVAQSADAATYKTDIALVSTGSQSTNSHGIDWFDRGIGGDNSGRIAVIRESSSAVYAMAFYTANASFVATERMRITSGGNVLIGNPATNSTIRLHVKGAQNADWMAAFDNTGTNPYGLRIDTAANSGGAYSLAVYTNSATGFFVKNDGTVSIGTTTNNYIVDMVTGANNSLLYLNQSNGAVGGNAALIANINTTGGYLVLWRYGGSTKGSITTDGTGVAYNTTSDYRLKEDFQNFNAIEKINTINVYDFKWKEISQRGYGVIAHELAEVLPQYVNGKKDGLDKEGNIQPQSVDYSKLVPVLVKGMQEQQCTICSQAAMINTLKTCLGIA